MTETASGKSRMTSVSGGKGPRSVVVTRPQNGGFGFTLRHFIVYPPGEDEESDFPEELKRRIASGALGNPKEPMDTIFVKEVREKSPAALAGLATGDRVIQVNGESVLGKSYAQVVQMIQNSGPALRLLVVPKEEDIIQLCFEETAHAPQTNPRPSSAMAQPLQVAQPNPARQRNHNQLLLHLPRPAPYISQQPSESTQRPLVVAGDRRVQTRAQIVMQPAVSQAQRSHLTVTPTHQQQILAQKRSFMEQSVAMRGKKTSTATLQVPSYLNRSLSPVQLSSGGVVAGDQRGVNRSLSPHVDSPRSRYSLALDSSGSSLTDSGSRNSYAANIDPTKPFSAFHYMKPSQEGTISNSAPSLNAQLRVADMSGGSSTGSLPQISERRESVASNVSVDTNDSVMNRLRKSFEQKEEFLNRPNQPYWPASHSPPVPREFYVQPQKFPKPMVWPPNQSRPPALQHSQSLPSDDCSVNDQTRPLSQSIDIPEPKTTVQQQSFVKSIEPWSLVFSVRKITPPSSEGDVSPSHTIITGSVGNTTPKPFYGSSSVGESPAISPSVSGQKQKGFVTSLSMISESGMSVTKDSRAPLARIDEMTQTPSPIQDRMEAKNTLTKHILSQQAKEYRRDTSLEIAEGLKRKSLKLKLQVNGAVVNNGTEMHPHPDWLVFSPTSLPARKMEFLSIPIIVERPPVGPKKEPLKFRDSGIRYAGMSGNRTVIVGSSKMHCEPPPRDEDTSTQDEPEYVMSREEDETPPSSLAEDYDRKYVLRQNSYRYAMKSYWSEKHARPVRPSQLSFTLPPTPDSMDESLDSYFVSPLSTPGSIASDFGDAVLEQFDDMLAALSSNRGPVIRNGSGVSVPTEASSMLNMQNAAVTRRTKILRDDEEERAMRRISYRKATANDRLHVDTDTDTSDQEQKLRSTAPTDIPLPLIRSQSEAALVPSPPLTSIQKLRVYFEEVASPQQAQYSYSKAFALWGKGTKGSSSRTSQLSSSAPITKERHPSSSFDLLREGWLNIKITQVDGKRATDRSWHQMWLRLRNQTLTIHKDKKDAQQVTSQYTVDSDQQLDLRGASVDIACDYTKRRSVLRLSIQNGAEYLVQCEDDQDMIRWMQMFQEASGTQVENQYSASEKLLRAMAESKQQKKIAPFYRNRSPTGHSPVSKTRKPSTAYGEPPMSPLNSKPRTWKNKVAKELKRFRGSSTTRHGADVHSPSSPSRERASFEMPLELCPMSPDNHGIPLLVDLCVRLVEARGLDVVGVYRVPGNTAAVTALTNSINQGFENANFQDARWNDTNVISSLLKLFFRKLPDPVLTSEMYPRFIEASKIEDLEKRKGAIKSLVEDLPEINYRTLSFLICHLARVAQRSETNKMDVRNIAIVFGPTLIRASGDNMATMVADMSHQCRIVETLINEAWWFFAGDEFDTSINQSTDMIDTSFEEKVGDSRESMTADEERGPFSPREIVASIINSGGRKANSSDSDIGASVAAEKAASAAPKKKDSKESLRRSSVSSTQSSSTGTAHGSVQSIPESATSGMSSSTLTRVPEEVKPASFKKEGSAAIISRLVERQQNQNEQNRLITEDKLKKREAERKAAFEGELERQRKVAELHRAERKRIDDLLEKAKLEMDDDFLDAIADNPGDVRRNLSGFAEKMKSLSLQSDDEIGPTTTQSSSQSGSISFSDNIREGDKFSQSADQVMLYIDDDLSDKGVPSASSCPLLSPNIISDSSRFTPTRKLGSSHFFPNDQSTPVESQETPPSRSQAQPAVGSPRRVQETRPSSSAIPQAIRNVQLRRVITSPLLGTRPAPESSTTPTVRAVTRVPARQIPVSKITRPSSVEKGGSSENKDDTLSWSEGTVRGSNPLEEKGLAKQTNLAEEVVSASQSVQSSPETSDDKETASKENQDPAELHEQTTPHKRLSASEDRHSFRRLSDMRNRDSKVRRSNSLTKDEKTESNNKARESQRRADSNRLHETRHSRSLRVRGTRDSGLKRRHTVGGTRDFDKVRFRWMVVDHPSTEERRLSAWDQLQPLVNDEDLNIDRTLRAWMRKERLRTSSPELSRKSDTVISTLEYR